MKSFLVESPIASNNMGRFRVIPRIILIASLALYICQGRILASNVDDYYQFIKEHKSVSGFSRLFQDDEDFYLEIPDSLIGRRVMLSSMITGSSSPSIPFGQELSKNPVFEIAKTDSLILFYSVDTPPSKSRSTKAIAYAFAKEYKISNSAIVKITNMFDPWEEDVIDLTGLTVEEGAIYNASLEYGKTLFNGFEGFKSSVCISREITYSLSLADKTTGLDIEDTPSLSLGIQTSLTLLPESSIELRKADPRIGVRTVSIKSIPDDDLIKDIKYASRWNLSRVDSIEIAIDSRFPKVWQKAISDGILEWNKAFEAIGLPDVIKTSVKDISDIKDPLCSSVRLGEDYDTELAARVLSDKTTGEILSANIMVPGNYLTGIRKATCLTISDIDERFKGYFLSDEAVYDVIKAQIMSIFCHCLGLQRNFAGSYAYTPEQLSNPSFVKEHGITASVSDDVLFNWFATDPSFLIQSSLGAYDYFAIEWLYKQFDKDVDTNVELKKLVDSKDGQKEYFFSSSQTYKSDPRAIQGDLSSDAIKSFDKAVEHLKNAIRSCSEWMNDESIPEDYASEYLDWAWLRLTNLLGNLAYCIGSFEKDDILSSNKSITPTPKTVQKQALEKIFSTLRDMSWIDSQKSLLQSAGANKDILSYSNANMFSCSKLSSRLEYVALCERLSGNDGYSTSEFLSDLQAQMLYNASKGKLSPSEETGISSYLTWLMGRSPVAKKNYSKATGNSSFAFNKDEVSLSDQPDSVDKQDLEVLCYASLIKAGTALKAGASKATDSLTRGRILYLASMVDAAFGNK